jgi:microcystin-dependent protein
MIPTGATGDPADTRFLLADGRALARTGQYALLFAAIGTSYGAGDGSTTFNIPDRRGRVGVGADNMGTAAGAAGRLPNSNRALGQNGGEERHTLTVAELAAHSHNGATGTESNDHTHGGSTDTQGNHWHSAGAGGLWADADNGVGGIFAASGGGGTVTALYHANTNSTGAHSHSISTGGRSASHTHTIPSNGSGTPHNVLQPYQVDNWLVRVK